MPAAPFWETTPDPWGQFFIGGRLMPGITRPTGRLSRKMDVRSPPGGDGARVRDRGYEPAPLELENRVWTEQQLEELRALLEIINPRGHNPPLSNAAQQEHATLAAAVASKPDTLGKDPVIVTRLISASRRARTELRAAAASTTRTPVDVVHPALSLLGIRSAYVAAVSVPELRAGQLYTTISLLEWTAVPQRAPRPATTSAGGGSANMQNAFDLNRASARPNAAPPARAGGS